MGLQRFEDKLTKCIYDDIHGFIAITPEEKELLGTMYFQRLNHIKQLSLSYFVFPGAVHTRFSHSLGVLHITEKIIQQIKKRGYDEFNDSKKHQIVRLAALLHDIGHYPLSHTIEKSYMEYAYYLKNSAKPAVPGCEIEDLSTFCNSQDINNFLQYYTKTKDSEINHEDFARFVIESAPFKKILFNLFPQLEDSDLEIICNLITGKYINDDYFISAKLINSRLDADQMDYMVRDTVNTGINASIDIDYIINNIDLCDKKYPDGKKRKTIAFSIKSIQVIEQFLLAKYYWYANILFYNKAFIVNNIAQRIYSYLLINNKIEHDYASIKDFKRILNETPEKYFFFNDDYFWLKIKDIIIENKNNIVSKLAKSLIERKFPKTMPASFFKEQFTSNILVNYSQILGQTIEFKKSMEEFNNKIEELNNDNGKYFGVCIEKDIAPEVIVRNYIDDKQINIIIQDSICENMMHLKNQFFQQFMVENKAEETDNKKEELKELKAFKIYDFSNILN